MINKIYILIFLLTLSNAHAEEVSCNNFKKSTIDYLKCKSNDLKKKTISSTTKMINETKTYQDKEWKKEKKKINKVKKKLLKDDN